MTTTTPTDPLKQARLRWKSAQASLGRHALRSDPQIDLDLLKQAKTFPTWRGPLALFLSWVLPQVPVFMGDGTGLAQALFVTLGGISLGFAVWFLFKDGTLWFRWAKARRSLANEDYRYRYLAPMAGLPISSDLSVVARDGEEWTTLGEWVKRDTQLEAVWSRWNASNPPIRQYDMRVLEEAIFALTKLQDLKAGVALPGPA